MLAYSCNSVEVEPVDISDNFYIRPITDFTF